MLLHKGSPVSAIYPESAGNSTVKNQGFFNHCPGVVRLFNESVLKGGLCRASVHS